MHGLNRVDKGRLQKMLGEEFDVLAPQIHVSGAQRVFPTAFKSNIALQVSLHTNWATNPVLREALAVIAGYISMVTSVLGLMHYEGWW